MYFPNYTDQNKRRDQMASNGSVFNKGAQPGFDTFGTAGKQMPAQSNSSWRDYLPAIIKGFQGSGLIGAGVGLVGSMLAKKKKPLGVIQN